MAKLSLASAQRGFEQVLPRLVGDYESGRLVPFLGSGMSIGACTSWRTMVERLEEKASAAARGATSRADPRELIERANSAVRSLKASPLGAFERAMRFAVVAKRNKVPKSTSELARLWWPLVLTTNYDNCYLAAFERLWPGELYAVVGRGSEDCQRVLNSLSNPGRPLLWALQGHMPAPCELALGNDLAKLERELVVGHEEYRRVTYRDPGFRRAFAEVFRQRSLLFLGAGIRESYLQELFGEVLEIYGPSARLHYAFMPQGEVDRDFMLARFQIRVIEFPEGEYDTVEAWIERIVEEAQERTHRQVTWGFHRGTRAQKRNPPTLEIVRSILPREREDGACIAIDSSRDRSAFTASRVLGKRADAWGVPKDAEPVERSRFVKEYVGSDVFLVSARADEGASSLTAVYDAALSLFRSARRRCSTIHMQLPESRSVPRMSKRSGAIVRLSFPARFSLIQTVRAWRAWRESHPDSERRLVLHTTSQAVLMEIAAGRLDVLELLSCRDVRFSTEIVRDDGTIERCVFELLPERTTLGDVVGKLDLAGKRWTVEVSPRANLHRAFVPVRPIDQWVGRTLHELGVVPGSTLHFRRIQRRRRVAP